METQPREPVIAAGLRRGRSGSGGDEWEGEALLHLVSRRRPLGEDFRRYPGERRTVPRRSSIAGRLTPLSCACPATPLTLFSPAFPPPRFTQPKRRRDEGTRRRERCAKQPWFFYTAPRWSSRSDTGSPLSPSLCLNPPSTGGVVIKGTK